MELLTPDEFFDRVGVRVPENVIRSLEARRGGIVGCRAKLERVDGDQVTVLADGRIAYDRATGQLDLLPLDAGP